MDLARRLAKLVGTTSVREILGGHQSQVFEVTRSGQRMVIKVQDASTLDRANLQTRVETVAELATIDPRVCGPVTLDGSLVKTLDGDNGWGSSPATSTPTVLLPTQRAQRMPPSWAAPWPICTNR